MSILFYHIFLWLYRTGIRLVAPWNPKARRWLDGRKNIFSRISSALPEKYPLIWMHCASLGEFEQGRPVLERLRSENPGYKILISFFSPSGYETRKDYEGADHVFYLPLDSRQNARRFIDLIEPSLVLWVKYDYWYYYLLELKRRGIPTILLSAVFRPDQPFFKWYGRLHRYMLECFTHLFVQTDASKKLLGRLGLSENVSVSGDTRFDRVIAIADRQEPLPLVAAFCGDQTVIVAGSTWEEDDEELDHYANTHPEIRFIVAPHEIEEDRLREAEKLFRHCVRYSQWGGMQDASDKLQASSYKLQASSQTPVGGETGKLRRGPNGGQRPPNVLIIDNIGLLSRLYQYATITYVGGGFWHDGVHNVLEAAVYGKPVVFGPVIEKYNEAVELADCGGGIVIDSALEAESVFDRLLGNPEEYRLICEASRDYVLQKKGATDKITGYIQEKRLLTS
jgi:3-deoxy-D-manno-octulosonic-acid transferase